MSDGTPTPPGPPRTGRGVLVFVLGVLAAGAGWLWYQRPEPVSPEVTLDQSVQVPVEVAAPAPGPEVQAEAAPVVSETVASEPVASERAEAETPLETPSETPSEIDGTVGAPETVTAEPPVAQGDDADPASGEPSVADATPPPVAEIETNGTAAAEDTPADPATAEAEVAPAAEDAAPGPEQRASGAQGGAAEPEGDTTEALGTEAAPDPVQTAEGTIPASEPDVAQAPVAAATGSDTTEGAPEAEMAETAPAAEPGTETVPEVATAPEPATTPGPDANDDTQETAGTAPGPAATQPEEIATAAPDGAPEPATGDESVDVALAEPNAAPAVVAQPVPAPEPATTKVVPTFDIIRIDATGAGLVAGTAQPFSTVAIMSGGNQIATAEASASGEFVAFIQSPSQDEGLQLSLLAQSGAEAAVGTETVLVLPAISEDGAAIAPTIVKADTEEVRVIQPSALGKVAGVTLDTISYDTEGAVRLSGRAPGPQDIRIYVDGAPVGAARASQAGTWDARLTQITEGRYVLRVDALREDGTVTSRAESPFQRVYPTAEQRQNPTQITVQPGNNLWVMAEDRYGSGFLYTQIFAANRDAIRDPDLIYPGQIFTLPKEEEFTR